ncbi:glycosyl hydrolase family 65, N-terminal domain-containing protein [Mycena olivaceomarginata]|nr:glycosyl hydrolase family 65, N-terminal domain-containing protein [Mycena olivaceomarginata]
MLVLTLALALALTEHVSGAPTASDTTLWFTEPAVNFTTSILLGNGRLGANLYGGLVNERLGLNEDSIWSGSPYDPAPVNCSKNLPMAREFVNQGNYKAAQDFLNTICMGHQRRWPAGSLLLNFTSGTGEIENYKRQLDLSSSVATVTYTQDNVTFSREVFVSNPAQVIVVHLTASKSGHLSFNASFSTPMMNPSTSFDGTTLVLNAGSYPAYAPVPAGLTYEARLQLVASGGSVKNVQSGSLEKHFTVSKATSATIFIAIASSFVKYDDISGNPTTKTVGTLAALGNEPDYNVLKAAHVAAYQQLFNRVAFDFGQNESAAALPTDVRAANFQNTFDPGFVALNLNWGRYLLIGSSWGGAQPPNLQGVWNEDLLPTWNSWGAEVANLADLVEPVVRLIEDVSITGAHMAQVMYNATSTAMGTGAGPGNGAPWMVHHNTDQWRATAPIDASFYGFWPTGGVFELQTIWEHYLFDPTNTTFVKRVYPLFRGASQFFLETLQVHPNNTDWLVVNPSMSPEKAFETVGGEDISTNLGTTMDNSMLRDLFSQTVTFARILGVDEDLSAQLNAAAARLPPFLIGSGGQLQEWLTDWDSKPSTFSHLSPLYGVYPSHQIGPFLNQTLSKAAETLLVFRGEFKTAGWPTAWRIATWARLLNATHVQNDIKILLSSNNAIWPNLMGKNLIFQIDSNLGALGTILETLLQSQGGEIHLLPAVPTELASGSFTGLRARVSATVTARLAGSAKTINFQVRAGGRKVLVASDFA